MSTNALEELLYQTLIQDVTITSKLAQFKGKPAVFEREAPADDNSGWGSAKQHPRIMYYVDIQEDVERKVSGQVYIDICIMLNATDGPDVVETALKNILDGVFFESTYGTVTLRWQKSNIYEVNDTLFTGMVVVFDLLAFPSMFTTAYPGMDSDPIYSLINWLRGIMGTDSAFFIDGTPQTESVWKPSKNKPAIYWRFINTKCTKVTNSVAWFTAQCACHIISPLPTDRLPYIQSICETLAKQDEIILGDGSPFILFSAIEGNSNADAISAGQITITGQYGVLRNTVGRLGWSRLGNDFSLSADQIQNTHFK